MIRAALHRADALLQQQDLSVREFVSVMGVLLNDTCRVVGLLKSQREINGDNGDGTQAAIYQALYELGKEWDLDLVGNSPPPGVLLAAAA